MDPAMLLILILSTLMCGRTVVSLAPDEMARACTFKGRNGKKKRPVWKDAPGGQQYRTSYNMAPGSFSPVLVASEHFGDAETMNESERVLIPMKWGLIPPWHKDDPFKIPFETNNCRVEGMLEKKTYKVPLHRGYRCVILVDGFYEWKTTKDGKQPFYFFFPSNKDATLDTSTYKDIPHNSSDGEKESHKVKLEVSDKVIKDEKPVDKDNFNYGSIENDDDDADLLMAAITCDGVVSPSTLTKCQNTDPKSRPLSRKIDNSFKLMNEKENHESFLVKADKRLQPSQNDENDVVKQEMELLSGKSFISDDKKTTKERLLNTDNGDEEQDCSGQKPLTIAGVYDIWKSSKSSEPIYSYSVITVPASKDMDWCHHRMPAILPTDSDVRDWLDFANVPMQQAASLIKPQQCLAFQPVSKKVNSSSYQASDCIKAVDLSVESKPKMSASSGIMMKWLSKTPTKTLHSASVSPESSPIKRPKSDA